MGRVTILSGREHLTEARRLANEAANLPLRDRDGLNAGSIGALTLFLRNADITYDTRPRPSNGTNDSPFGEMIKIGDLIRESSVDQSKIVYSMVKELAIRLNVKSIAAFVESYIQRA